MATSSSPVARRDSGRRTFLRTAALASVASVLPSRLPGATGPEYATSSDPTTDLIWMSATKLAQLIREKKVSATEAVNAYIQRIDAVNPKINAVVMRCFDRALAEAKAADESLAKGKLLGPLHGVPMTIKDSLDTAGVVTTGGTMGRINHVPEKDATAVARARAAGAILLGKTNTPEFTLAGYSGISTTWNLIYGITRNPYNNLHSSAGSSGGAGAIVAAGGAAFDIGSDFGGSIRGPAHANGVAGIKPTTGRVPRTGHIVDFGGLFDAYQQIGPLARKVEDLMLITPLIAGPDGKDAAIIPAAFPDASGIDLKKLRVAFYPTSGYGAAATPEMQAVVRKAAAAMSALGASVNEDVHPHYGDAVELRTALRAADGNTWMKRLADKMGSKTVSPNLAFSEPKNTSAELIAMLQTQDKYRRAMTQWFKNYDVILCPANAGPAPRIDDRRTGTSYTAIYNISGWPALVFRGGTSPEGLPLGLQVVAKPFREDVAFAVARHLETVLGGWQKPAI